MAGPDTLYQSEDHWQTRMGVAMLQERVVFRGKDLHDQLGDLSWMEIYLYGITGRKFNELELKILNAIWVYTSYPDPRIWNNRVAGLAGSVRSSGALSLGAAIAVSDAEIFGGKPLIRAIDFLIRAKKLVDEGHLLKDVVDTEIDKFKIISGYGRPRAAIDERIQPMQGFLDRVGYSNRQHLDLAFQVEKVLLAKGRKTRLNYAAFIAALCADMGLNPTEFYMFVIPLFLGGFGPCYLDAINHSEGTLFPLRCERIDYHGPKIRCWD